MSDPGDWDLATWRGNRRRQHQEFLALTFRQKMEVVERLGQTAAYFAQRRRERGLAVRERSPAAPFTPPAPGPSPGPSTPDSGDGSLPG